MGDTLTYLPHSFDAIRPFPRKSLFFRPGCGQALPQDNLPPPFSLAVQRLQQRLFHPREKLTPRDLKLRLHEFKEKDGTLLLSLGLTTFYDYLDQEKMAATEEGRKQLLSLQHRATQRFHDLGAYLARPLAVLAVILTSDTRLVVSLRAPTLPHGGTVHGIGGSCELHSVRPLGPGTPLHFSDLRIDPFLDMQKELEEEANLHLKDLHRLHLVGLSAHPLTLETDLVFLAETKKDSGHFSAGGNAALARDIWESQGFLVLKDAKAVLDLLEKGIYQKNKFEVLYSTETALRCALSYFAF